MPRPPSGGRGFLFRVVAWTILEMRVLIRVDESQSEYRRVAIDRETQFLDGVGIS